MIVIMRFLQNCVRAHINKIMNMNIPQVNEEVTPEPAKLYNPIH